MKRRLHEHVLMAIILVVDGYAVHTPTTYAATKEQDGIQACHTIEYIETINQHELIQIADVRGASAKLLLALNPDLSSDEFQYKGYRDKYFMAEMKKMRELLMKTDIDEVIIWKLPRPEGLGVAVPFKNGCAISEIGSEPDFLDKFVYIYEAYNTLMKQGLHSASLRVSIKNILMHTDYSDKYNDKMVDVMINNIGKMMPK